MKLIWETEPRSGLFGERIKKGIDSGIYWSHQHFFLNQICVAHWIYGSARADGYFISSAVMKSDIGPEKMFETRTE